MATTDVGSDKPAATFLQISDLHIGDVDRMTGDAVYNSVAQKVVSNSSWLDGLLGHHGMALQQLEQFCAEPELAGGFELIVTGDFTRTGSNTELDTAKEYIASDVLLVPPSRAGLRLGRAQMLGIPGNHDHWAGKFQPFGGHPSNYANAFSAPTLPWVDDTRRVGERRLVFAAIDSDCDVGPFSQARVLAKGDFQTQLAQLASKLGAFKPGDIRVLLIHHSWHSTGWKLRMRRSSKRALDQFLEQNQFSVMLTGHMHGSLLKVFNVGASKAPVWELRCGTTTQHDVTPYSWTTVSGTFPSRTKWPQNTLIVHNIHVTLGQTVWEAQVYERTKSGFRSTGHAGHRMFTV